MHGLSGAVYAPVGVQTDIINLTSVVVIREISAKGRLRKSRVTVRIYVIGMSEVRSAVE